MSGADQVRARFGAKAPRAADGAPVGVKPIRSTVDLAPARHHGLAAWQAETAQELGRPAMYRTEVLSELVGLLLTDETTARKLRARLADQ